MSLRTLMTIPSKTSKRLPPLHTKLSYPFLPAKPPPPSIERLHYSFGSPSLRVSYDTIQVSGPSSWVYTVGTDSVFGKVDTRGMHEERFRPLVPDPRPPDPHVHVRELSDVDHSFLSGPRGPSRNVGLLLRSSSLIPMLT